MVLRGVACCVRHAAVRAQVVPGFSYSLKTVVRWALRAQRMPRMPRASRTARTARTAGRRVRRVRRVRRHG